MKYKISFWGDKYVVDERELESSAGQIGWLEEFANNWLWLHEPFVNESIDSIEASDNADEKWAEFDALQLTKKSEFREILENGGVVHFTNAYGISKGVSCEPVQECMIERI